MLQLCPAEREPGTLTLLRPPPLELRHAQAHACRRGAAVARIAQEADRLIAAPDSHEPPRSPVPDCRFTPETDERRDTVALRIAVRIKRHDGRRLILSPEGRDLTIAPRGGAYGGDGRASATRVHIVRALGLAYAWREELLNTGRTLRTLADEQRIALTRVKLLLQLTNLSPAILKATLTGTLPPRITLKNLHAAARELDWPKQAAILGID